MPEYTPVSVSQDSANQWSNPSNVLVRDGAYADFTHTPQAIGVTTEVGYLYVAFNASMGSIPSTLTLKIRHMVDVTSVAARTVTFRLWIAPAGTANNPDWVLVDSWTQGSRNDGGTLFDNEYDITSHVSGWTLAEIETMDVILHAYSDLNATLNPSSNTTRWWADSTALATPETGAVSMSASSSASLTLNPYVTLESPAHGSTITADTAQTFSWTINDAGGESQTHYQFRRTRYE